MKKTKKHTVIFSLSLRSYYWAWFLSMVLFLTSLFFISRAPVTPGAWLGILVLTILGGVVFFLILMAKILSSLKTKNARWYGVATLATFFIFFWLMFNHESVEAKLGIENKNTNNSVAEPTDGKGFKKCYFDDDWIVVSNDEGCDQEIRAFKAAQALEPTIKPNVVPTAKKTTNNNIDCVGPDGVHFESTQEKCNEFNSAWGNNSGSNLDPNKIVKCNIHPNCGSGYREMTSSSCDQMICCGNLDGSYSFMSKSQCSAIETNFYADLERESQEFDDYWASQDQYYQEEQIRQAKAAAEEAALNAELRERIKQDCLKTASASYQSALRSCDSQLEHFRSGCTSAAYQQYARNKGACN